MGIACGKGFRIFLIRDHPRKSAVAVAFDYQITRSRATTRSSSVFRSQP
jgi:hypothetical protein